MQVDLCLCVHGGAVLREACMRVQSDVSRQSHTYCSLALSFAPTVVLLLWDRISLCGSAWPGTQQSSSCHDCIQVVSQYLFPGFPCLGFKSLVSDTYWGGSQVWVLSRQREAGFCLLGVLLAALVSVKVAPYLWLSRRKHSCLAFRKIVLIYCLQKMVYRK